MTRARVLVSAAFLALLLAWWLSGLGRPEANPLDYFTQAQLDRASSYRLPRYAAFLGASLASLAVLALLSFGLLGDRLLRPILARPWALAVLAVGAVVVAVDALARFPFAFWSGLVHERDWGFSTQSTPGWLADWAKALGIRALLVVATVTLLLFLVRVLPRLWPAVAVPLAALIVVAGSFLWPVLIEPAFNRFEPLADRPQAGEFRDLAARAGVPVRDVLVADASRRTTKENAYVSGFGGSRRLVLYDTLLHSAPAEEVRLVVAHELGHEREGHVEKGTAIGAAGAAVGVLGLWLLLRSRRLLRAAGAERPSDPRAVPLIILAAMIATLAALPMSNWVSRRFEEDADRFALALTGEAETYVTAMRGLALRNLSNLDPDPLAYRFLFTHPSVPERLSFAEGVAGS